MVWAYPKIQEFWASAVEVIIHADRCLGQDPRILLLGVLDTAEQGYVKLFFLPSPTIPPTITSWCTAIDTVLPLYELAFESCNCPRKFDKIWSAWIDSLGI